MKVTKLELALALTLLGLDLFWLAVFRHEVRKAERRMSEWTRGRCTVVSRRVVGSGWEDSTCLVRVRPDHDPSREPPEFGVSDELYQKLPIGANAAFLYDPRDPKAGYPEFVELERLALTRGLTWSGAVAGVFLVCWAGWIVRRLRATSSCRR